MSVLKEDVKHVLIVDDEPEILQILSIIVKTFGDFSIDLAEDGFEAAKKIARKYYDLILLDVMMPRVDGIQVCKALRGNPRTVNIPVIIISAAQSFDVVVECTKSGANDYIVKPFERHILKEKINKFVQLPVKTEPEVNQFVEKEEKDSRLSEAEYDSLVVSKKIKELIFNSVSCPIIPETLLNLSRCLKSGSGDISDILRLDIGVSLDLLLVANSAFYSGKQTITSIKSSVNIIGEEEIKNNLQQMVRADNVVNKSVWYCLYSGFFLEYILRAYFAKVIAEHENYYNPEEAYSIALLKDIGRYFLLNNFYELYAKIIQDAPLFAETLFELEQGRLGITNNKVTELLIHYLSLPTFIKTFFSSNNVSVKEDFNIKKLREIIELADYLKKIIGYNYGDKNYLPKSPKYLPVKYMKFIDYAKEVMSYVNQEVNVCCEKFTFHESVINYPQFTNKRVFILAKKMFDPNSSQITLKIFLEFLGFEVYCDVWDKLSNLDNMRFDLLILDISTIKINEIYKISGYKSDARGLLVYDNKYVFGKIKKNFSNLVPKINVMFHDDLINEFNKIIN